MLRISPHVWAVHCVHHNSCITRLVEGSPPLFAMNTDKHIALALADTMLAREARLEALIEAVNWAFDARLPWVAGMCETLLERTGENFHHFSREELASIILGLLGRVEDEWDEDEDEYEEGQDSDDDADVFPFIALPSIKRYCIDLPIRPQAEAWLEALALPSIPTLGDLARLLNVETDDLAWFADEWRLLSSAQPRLQHYHYRWVAKRSGGWRLIEIPKQRLKHIQQTILRKIVDLVPPHEAAHGFRRGRSCITHAAMHAGRRAVIRMDLKDFFPSIPASRIQALFAKLGYSDSVAGTLARLCTSRTPAGAFADRHSGASLPWAQRHALRSPHLPQGSPCSPALANLCAWRLDLRLAALAASMGAVYSRYADDLAFSGGAELERARERFHVQVAAIAIEEGFKVNTRKTRLMRAGVRQQLTGLVVNAHPNLPRAQFDKLKAILHNCARCGPRSQNRDGHADFRAYLSGKVAWARAVNPERGARLQRLLAAIDWDAA